MNEIAASDFVFSGTLIDSNNGQLTFQINDIWKGKAKDTITFLSWGYSKNGERFIDSCDFIFEKGKSYLVYGNTTIDGFKADKCGRTSVLENAERDVREIKMLMKKDSANLLGVNLRFPFLVD